MPLYNAQRRDGNESEIVEALRRVGADVIFMDKSAGFDLLVLWGGMIYALEVKQPGEKLTKREADLRARFDRHDAPYLIVHNADEALDIIF